MEPTIGKRILDRFFPEGRMKIKHLILILLVLIISSSLVMQFAFYQFFAKDYYTDYKAQKIDVGFLKIKRSFDGTIDSIEPTIVEMEENDNISIVIKTSDTVYYSSALKNLDTPTSAKIFEEAYESGYLDKNYSPNPDVLIAEAYGTDTEYLSTYGTFIFDGETYYVDITLPLASIESSVDILGRATLWISLFALALGIIFSTAASVIITRPIKQVEMVTGDLANLNFGRRVSEKSSIVEMYRVTKSINRMSTELEEALMDLEEALRELSVVNQKLKDDINSQKRVDEMRKAFVANVSHEMKTPLALLQLYAENLKGDIIDPVDREYYLSTIVEETNNLNDMVVSMLDVSALENGFNQMKFYPISMSYITASLVDTMRPLLANFKLETEISEDLYVVGDEKYLLQAMRNYINNAITHTSDGELIRIKLYSEDTSDEAGREEVDAVDDEGNQIQPLAFKLQPSKYVVFSIFNKGSNIPKNEEEQIWDSFYRADKARTRSSNNIGMGLYLVKTVMNKHDGIYEVINHDDGVEFLLKVKMDETSWNELEDEI